MQVRNKKNVQSKWGLHFVFTINWTASTFIMLPLKSRIVFMADTLKSNFFMHFRSSSAIVHVQIMPQSTLANMLEILLNLYWHSAVRLLPSSLVVVVERVNDEMTLERRELPWLSISFRFLLLFGLLSLCTKNCVKIRNLNLDINGEKRIYVDNSNASRARYLKAIAEESRF